MAGDIVNGAFVLLLLIIVLLLLREHLKKERYSIGIEGDFVYSDASMKKVEKALFSKKYMLTGKPDYIVDNNGKIHPVELKSMTAPDKPYNSHIMQLMSYCLLIEDNYGKIPDYGVLKYTDKHFRIAYGNDEKKMVTHQLTEMRNYLDNEHSPKRDHDIGFKCRACQYRKTCDEVKQ